MDNLTGSAGVIVSGTDPLNSPLITVAMPVYNAGIHLRLALLSILQQSFTDWELLLIDDGSTDGAVEGVADVVDTRIRTLRDGKNRGLAARLNEAIDLAQGQFFARMDQDDISHPERFLLQIGKLLSDPLLDLVGAQCVTISETNELLGALPKATNHHDIWSRPWLGFYLAHPTWMGRTEWFRKHRYASPGPYCCEDQELLLRTHRVSRFHALPQQLLAYRIRDRLVLKKAWRTRKTLYQVQCRYFRNSRQYARICLSSIVFLLRTGMDISVAVKQFLFAATNRGSENGGLSGSEADEWRVIIHRLEEKQAA